MYFYQSDIYRMIKGVSTDINIIWDNDTQVKISPVMQMLNYNFFSFFFGQYFLQNALVWVQRNFLGFYMYQFNIKNQHDASISFPAVPTTLSVCLTDCLFTHFLHESLLSKNNPTDLPRETLKITTNQHLHNHFMYFEAPVNWPRSRGNFSSGYNLYLRKKCIQRMGFCEICM